MVYHISDISRRGQSMETNNRYYYTLNSLTLFSLAESVKWIFEISARNVITTDYTIIMSRSRVIMSRSRVTMSCMPQCKISKGNYVNFARLVLLAISEETETWLPSFCFQCIIKQLLDSVFVISRIIKVSVKVISLSLLPRLITRITKTSSNNSS